MIDTLAAWSAIILLLQASAAPPDFSGRWAGDLRLEFPNGVQQQQAFLTLRQFGANVEGTFGYSEDIQSRLKPASADGDRIRTTTGGVELDLRLDGDRLVGEVRYAGPGAPRTSALFRRVTRGNGGATRPESPSAVGDIRVIDGFPMPELGRTRRVLVYLPPGYEGGTARYPVIYMTDGQNLFDVMTSDRGEWCVDETLERMHAQGRTAGTIVVGVEHGGPVRSMEYMPASLGAVPGAEGEKYAEFVVRSLKPSIDRAYRTLAGREHTGVIGASAGAQMAFYLGTEYPAVFSKVGALGLVMGRGARENIARWRSTHAKHPGMRFYLHVGTEENVGGPADNQAFVENLKQQYEALRALGYDDTEVMLDVEPGAHHTEAFWSRRFERVFEWLFGNGQAGQDRDAGSAPVARR
ncbi:MAG TPA: alpha/beta hydrolase-fold protein [Vicinamibacterales bacterium]|nr:alpha/beta hydrolase-fold protein [Vicinamibacterales bacterium]